MPITEPFEEHTDRYEGWFEAHDYAYQSELRALERLVPDDPDGIEIGVGTGRFAAPLGVQTGIDPAPGMLQRAAERDIAVARGVAEALPFADGAFGTALLVTTVCFVDDLNRTFEEARRVIRSGGRVVVGYIDTRSGKTRIRFIGTRRSSRRRTSLTRSRRPDSMTSSSPRRCSGCPKS